MKLPQNVYEILRWFIWIVLPAFEVLLTTISSVWAWNIPLDAVLSTMSAVELFLGTVLGIAKVSNDKEE